MNEIDIKFKVIRTNLRQFGMEISEDVFKRFHPSTISPPEEICVFCNSTTAITKEHVLPRWFFERDTHSTFISSVNKQKQTYNKAVIPTCSECNNSLLSHIEIHIKGIVQQLDRKHEPSFDDISNIIRWLEMLDYKFQVYDCRRKYIKYGDSEYYPLIASFPVAMMRHFLEFNSFKALSYLRNSQRRMTVKSKAGRINSLVIMDTGKPQMYFFTQPNEYMFVSFPMYSVAVFYFLRKSFNSNTEAYSEALYFMGKVFES